MNLLVYTYQVGKLHFGTLPDTYTSRRDAIRSAKRRAQFGGDWVVTRYNGRGRAFRVWQSWVSL